MSLCSFSFVPCSGMSQASPWSPTGQRKVSTSRQLVLAVTAPVWARRMACGAADGRAGGAVGSTTKRRRRRSASSRCARRCSSTQTRKCALTRPWPESRTKAPGGEGGLRRHCGGSRSVCGADLSPSRYEIGHGVGPL
eukprot:1187813-Prorocentrum_minimum.AAC.6